MTFNSFDSAFDWAKTYGRENCRPCDMWKVVQVAFNEFKVAIHFKASDKFVGYAS